MFLFVLPLLGLGLPSVPFPSGFPTRTPYAFLFPLARAPHLARPDFRHILSARGLPVHPRYRGYTITFRHITLYGTPLDELS
jgi:hypothetical protein